jgi:DNA-binding protein HU-beta
VNKADIVEKIANDVGVPKTVALRVLDTVLESIKDALAAGEQVILVGFGTFMVKERAARTGRNPRTGEEIKISATAVASFKPGKGLKEAVCATEEVEEMAEA